MANRNLKKLAEEGRELVVKHKGYGMNVSELDEIKEQVEESLAKGNSFYNVIFHLIYHVYTMGIATGYRMSKAEQKKADKVA